MAALDLQLTLDPHSTEYRGGEVIEGSIETVVHERCECRAITVGVRWVAKSRYESDEELIPGVTLDGGTFEPGFSRTDRFSITLPRPAWSYAGQTFNLQYAVHAKADLPNVADVHAEQPIEVKPAQDIGAQELAPSLGVILEQTQIPVGPLAAERTIAADQLVANFKPGCMLIVGFLALLMALPFLAVSIFMFSLIGPLFRDVGAIAVIPLLLWMVLGVGLPLVFGGGMVYAGARPYLARRRLGEVGVDIPERLVAPGGRITCRVSMQPRHDLEIQQVRVILRARETVWRRTKNSRQAQRRTIRAEEHTLEGARSVRAGELVELTGRLDVPTDGPYSLGTPNHWLEWHVIVHVALRGWIDHQSEHLVTVAPIAATSDQ